MTVYFYVVSAWGGGGGEVWGWGGGTKDVVFYHWIIIDLESINIHYTNTILQKRLINFRSYSLICITLIIYSIELLVCKRLNIAHDYNHNDNSIIFKSFYD